MKTIDPKKVATKYLHGLMLSAIGPRPICFASTINKKGEPNLSPFSFFNMFSSNPPTLIFSPSRRVRDNTIKHTLENVLETKEVVVNIVNHAIVQQASLSSTEYSKGVNEFEKAGLTMLASEEIAPFRVAESPAQFECKVKEVIHLGTEGGAGNLVLCEVVKAHVDERFLDESGMFDQHKIDLVSRMGGNWYSRANMGLFEVPKPLTSLGIGVDQIPFEIRNSAVLTGNDLGKLGNVEKLPLLSEIDTFVTENKLATILRESTTEKIHEIAQTYLKEDEPTKAWKILMAK